MDKQQLLQITGKHRNKEEYCGEMGYYPANTFLLKLNNGNTRRKGVKYVKLAIKTPERHQWRRSGV